LTASILLVIGMPLEILLSLERVKTLRYLPPLPPGDSPFFVMGPMVVRDAIAIPTMSPLIFVITASVWRRGWSPWPRLEVPASLAVMVCVICNR